MFKSINADEIQKLYFTSLIFYHPIFSLFSFSRPQEIVKEIYPHHAKLKSAADSSDENNNLMFDSVVEEVVNIIVSYDMG